MAERTCIVCRASLEGRRADTIYCTKACTRWAERNNVTGIRVLQPESRECAHCGTAFSTTKGTQRFCTERCRKTQESARAKQRRAATDTGVYLNALKGDPCAYCGAPSEQLDHIDPRARGGADDWSNLTPACADCNITKSDLPLLPALLYLWITRTVRPLEAERRQVSQAWDAARLCAAA